MPNNPGKFRPWPPEARDAAAEAIQQVDDLAALIITCRAEGVDRHSRDILDALVPRIQRRLNRLLGTLQELSGLEPERGRPPRWIINAVLAHDWIDRAIDTADHLPEQAATNRWLATEYLLNEILAAVRESGRLLREIPRA